MPTRLLSVTQALEYTGIGRANLNKRIASGEIRSVKIGKRRLIPETAIDEYIAELEAAQRNDHGAA